MWNPFKRKSNTPPVQPNNFNVPDAVMVPKVSAADLNSDGKAVFYQSAEGATLAEAIGNAVLAVWKTVRSGGAAGADIQVQDEEGNTVNIFVPAPGFSVYARKEG